MKVTAPKPYLIDGNEFEHTGTGTEIADDGSFAIIRVHTENRVTLKSEVAIEIRGTAKEIRQLVRDISNGLRRPRERKSTLALKTRRK